MIVGDGWVCGEVDFDDAEAGFCEGEVKRESGKGSCDVVGDGEEAGVVREEIVIRSVRIWNKETRSDEME